MFKKIISDRNLKKARRLILEGDYENGAKYLQKEAEDGHADAQYCLGDLYYYGLGVARNTEEALSLISKAAEQGHAGAKNRLDYLIKLLKKRIEKGTQQVEDPEEQDEVEDPEEQVARGRAYLNGEGVEQDDKEAVKWYRKAAEQGLDTAQFNLGMCYYQGRGVQKNLSEAFEWISEALGQGEGGSKPQSILGQMYLFGEGTTQNFSEAVKWLRKASYIITSEKWIDIESIKKDADAQFYMGWCYLTGNGATKNIEYAEQMFIAAASRNENHSLRVLKSIREEGNSLEDIRISIIRIHTKDGWNETMLIHPDGKSEVKLVTDGLESPPDKTKTTGKVTDLGEEKNISEKGLDKKEFMISFWQSLLDSANKSTNLHKNVKPSERPYVIAGVKKYLEFIYTVLNKGARVDLYINSGDKAKNKMIYDSLFERRAQIEKTFGDELKWERLDGKDACRISKLLDVGSYKDKEKWPVIQKRMINAMVCLEKAMMHIIMELDF